MRIHADADAYRHTEFLTDQYERLGHGSQDFFRDHGGVTIVFHFGQDGDKFVSTHARDDIAFTQRSIQSVRHLLEQFIDSIVTHGVIDLLETVKVEEYKG